MNALYTRLFTYNDWANTLLIDALAEMEPPGQALERLSHILNAQQVWLARLTAQPRPADLLPKYPIGELRTRNAASTEAWLTYTSRLLKDKHLEMISYRTGEGVMRESMVIDILAQVINHSTHHRGQIVASIRAAGVTPPTTDFIFFTYTARMRS